jgi:hypothetical protein
MSDTQPAQAPKGEDYGEANAMLERQQAQPIAGAATGNPSPGTTTKIAPGSQTTGPLAGMGPGQIPSLADPSAFPDEPITAGLPGGPGPGPEALRSAAFGPQELSVMRAIFLKYPNDDLRRLIEWTEQNLG